MSALPEEWVILSDGRDLDPPEVDALASSRVHRVAVQHLDPSVLPIGPVIIHMDLDVIDPAQLRGLRFPASGGPALAALAKAVRAVAATNPVAALDIAATWRPDAVDRTQTDAALQAVTVAAGLPMSR
jgi:arginase